MNRPTIVWLVVALAVFGVGTLYSRRSQTPTAPSWQRPVSELTPDQERFHTQLRALIREAERERGATKQWPAALFPEPWELRQQNTYSNYLGERNGLRWLVLFIEPDARNAPENVPEDDEHHRLSDGTAIHVTVWTQPTTEPVTERVTAFPAAEGWVERVSR